MANQIDRLIQSLPTPLSPLETTPLHSLTYATSETDLQNHVASWEYSQILFVCFPTPAYLIYSIKSSHSIPRGSNTLPANCSNANFGRSDSSMMHSVFRSTGYDSLDST